MKRKIKKQKKQITRSRTSSSFFSKHKHLHILLIILGVCVVAFLVVARYSLSTRLAQASTCTPTGFFRDSINMTAAKINPGKVMGDVDATGCNIGVYFDKNGSVSGANIHGANYFGVVVNGDVNNASVDVQNSSIHDIGETPLNGAQHGVAIYYRNFGTGGMASGKIWSNTIYNYQKGGIVANGTGTTVDIKGNTVNGQGSVNYIAQNGIQIGYGARAQVMGNTVTDNSYSGTNNAASGGILAVGGACYGGDYTTKTEIKKNIVMGNDVGIWLSNLQGDCISAPTTQTNIKVDNNSISNGGLANISGNGFPVGYQAGIADQGYNDKLINNAISGNGYNPANSSSSIFVTDIDASTSFTNKAKVHANSFSL